MENDWIYDIENFEKINEDDSFGIRWGDGYTEWFDTEEERDKHYDDCRDDI